VTVDGSVEWPHRPRAKAKGGAAAVIQFILIRQLMGEEGGGRRGGRGQETLDSLLVYEIAAAGARGDGPPLMRGSSPLADVSDSLPSADAGPPAATAAAAADGVRLARRAA
jgi:hypothetical protein